MWQPQKRGWDAGAKPWVRTCRYSGYSNPTCSVCCCFFGATQTCLWNVHAHNSCSTENFVRGIQIRENAAFQWFRSAKCQCSSLNQNRSISQAKRLHQPRALLRTVNMLRRFQKSIPWPLLMDWPTWSWLAALRIRAQFSPLTCRQKREQCLIEEISDRSIVFLIPGSYADPVLMLMWVL